MRRKNSKTYSLFRKNSILKELNIKNSYLKDSKKQQHLFDRIPVAEKLTTCYNHKMNTHSLFPHYKSSRILQNVREGVLSVCTILFLSVFPSAAQVPLKSDEEMYFDFLSLTGNAERNYMNFRTIEETAYEATEESGTDVQAHVWQGKNLGKTHTIGSSSLKWRIYPAQWYSNYNTKAPFGQNDGGLWQGKGYNTSLSGGARFEAFGFSLSLRPQLSWSQNREFETMPSKNGTSEFGYFWGRCDAPQRFGDSSFWTFDWGDTEIRYSWKKLTIGFGTEAVWLGPAFVNPVLLSNNAGTFPKIDVGLRKSRIIVPHFGWYLGDIETRLFVGRLTESDYFDDDSSNDHNQISVFSLSYAPPFLKGLTLGVNKVTLSKWGDDFWLYAWPGFKGNTRTGSKTGRVGEDQKASITADWVFPRVGLEIYGELGFDDFLADGLSLYEYLRYPFHTITYTWGMKKTFEISPAHKIRGVLHFEWNNTEGSQDYQLWSGASYNFGFHHQITQGYTNRGQWLGSGIGYGGNSQYLSFTVYSPHGYERIFVARNNIDNNYIYYQAVDADKEETEYNGARYFTAFKANFYIGFENLYYILNNLSVQYGFAYNMIINPTYEPGYNSSKGAWRDYSYWNNFLLTFALKYQF